MNESAVHKGHGPGAEDTRRNHVRHGGTIAGLLNVDDAGLEPIRETLFAVRFGSLRVVVVQAQQDLLEVLIFEPDRSDKFRTLSGAHSISQ
ncbi:MAG: hypothetical protein ACYTHJ_19080 [Planctomycetota bacterium]